MTNQVARMEMGDGAGAVAAGLPPGDSGATVDAGEAGPDGALLDERRELARILGQDAPVSEAVLRAALANPSYAHNLLVSRREPRFMARLLSRPPRQAAGESRDTATLAATAAKSLARWAATGFSTVDTDRLQARLAVCAACPHLIAPPDGRDLLYRALGAGPENRSVCGQCGCVVTAKARRASETCPDPDPDRAGVTRWGDPLPAATART